MDTTDHIVFTFTGPGTRFQAFGLMLCYPWCYQGIGFQPDTSAPLGEVFVDSFFGPVIIGGKSYNATAAIGFFAPEGYLNPSGIVVVYEAGTFKEIELSLPPLGGQWTFQFDYIPPHDDSPGGYVFRHGEFYATSPPTPVPEPGTLGLMATGLAGITGLIRRKRLFCGRRPK